MNFIIEGMLYGLLITGCVSVIVIPILLVADHLQEDRKNAVNNLDCNQLLIIIQDNDAVKYDYAVREWIGNECWRG